MHGAVTPEPSPSVGQDTERLRDELVELQRAWALNRASDRPAFADAILATPALRQLIAERDEARAELRELVEAVSRGDHVLPGAYLRALAYVRALDER